jgi:hypothetical protein
MSLRSYLQDHPKPLVWAWVVTEKVLMAMKPIFQRGGLEPWSEGMHVPERLVKSTLFDCQDCGQCVLHYTGMTCPMTCPKNLRNGPCGGVRLDGKCEVKPEMDCVWTKAYARAQKTPWPGEFYRLNPPVDWRLHGMASWVTMPLGRDQIPTGTDVKIRYATEAVAKPAQPEEGK